jgi:ABC-type multidrug transport system ATPase subunit
LGADAGCDVVIDGKGVSPLHAVIRALPDGSLEIEDLDTFHGTFIDGVRIDRAPLRPGSRLDLAGTTLRLADGALHRVAYTYAGSRLDVHRVSATAPSGARLLNDVSLSILPGDLVAVVGPSGAGKSSLVRTLVGENPPTSGVVLLDGDDLYAHRHALRRRIGYLPQQPFLHSRLTVREAVRQGAALRLADIGSADVAEARVSEALHLAQIDHRADARLDTLSGGERKRAHLAAELVGEPAVLILDEPTSGLDPLLDSQMMELFRTLANTGLPIVIVTHSLARTDLCDRLVIVGQGGGVCYDGSAEAAPAWFGAPDLIATMAVIGSDPDRAAELHRQRRATFPEPARTRRDRTPDAPPAPSFLQRWRVLSGRSWGLLVRDRRTLTSLILQAPLIGAALWAVTTAHAFSNTHEAAKESVVVGFALVLVTVWLAMLASAREVTKEVHVIDRERLLGVGTAEYLLSKATVFIPIAALQAAVILPMVLLAAGMPPHGVFMPGALEVWVSLMLGSLAASGTGLIISATSSNEDRATALVPYALLPQFLLAGVAFPVPDFLRPAQFVTVAYWGVSAVGSTIDACAHPFFGGLNCEDALGVPFIHSASSLGTRWLVLVAMTAAVWGCAGLLLARRDRARRYR